MVSVFIRPSSLPIVIFITVAPALHGSSICIYVAISDSIMALSLVQFALTYPRLQFFLFLQRSIVAVCFSDEILQEARIRFRCGPGWSSW